jgi:hypothetical protein
MCKRRFYAFIKKKAAGGEGAGMQQNGKHNKQLAGRM